jgi:hypothetical protein
MEAKVVSKLPLPFDVQEYILVNIMKLYKLRDGKYVRQIDKTKYKFLDYIMRPSINKNSYIYIHDVFNNDENKELLYYKFYIKNLYDSPIRKESYIDDDIVDVRIECKNNIYYYEISIYRLKLKNIEENNFTPEKMRKDIYHKGLLEDTCFWDFIVFSYEVK